MLLLIFQANCPSFLFLLCTDDWAVLDIIKKVFLNIHDPVPDIILGFQGSTGKFNRLSFRFQQFGICQCCITKCVIGKIQYFRCRAKKFTIIINVLNQ